MAEASEESLHRLAGTSPEAEAGGLVLRGRSAAAEQHVFKAPAPRASLLGLDVLAARKRREREEEAAGGKRSRVSSYKDWEEGRDEAGSPEEDEDEEEDTDRSSRRARKDRWGLRGGVPGAGGGTECFTAVGSLPGGTRVSAGASAVSSCGGCNTLCGGEVWRSPWGRSSIRLRRSGKSPFTGALPEVLWAGVLLDALRPANTGHPSCETCLLPDAWRQWPAQKCACLRASADLVGC